MYEKVIGKTIYFNENIIKITEYIALGGNSIVFGCEYKSKKYVIKFFNGNNQTRYKRFKLEIEKIKDVNSKIKNYTPNIICYSLPKKYCKFNENNFAESPFYIMEKGEKFNFKLLNFEEKLNQIIFIAQKLKELHSLGCVHRDIKPENIIIYKGKITLIDFGTASFPNIKTIEENGAIGSRGTISPEMNDPMFRKANKKNTYLDIYSFGKTLWIILMNNKYSSKFTTYESSNDNVKLKMENVSEGIITAFEEILYNTTKENYLERISIEEVLEKLYYIKNKLLNNNDECNNMKFRCLLKSFENCKYDDIIIKDETKIFKFITTHIIKIGVILSLREVNPIVTHLFTISKIDNYYCFQIDEINYKFKIKEIIINPKKIQINTLEIDDIIQKDSIKVSNIDSFSKKSILTSIINDEIKNIYIDCEIFLDKVDEK